jgi:alpha-mannosidase
MALAKESLISHLRTNRLQAFGLLLCITAVLSTPWARGAEQRSEVFHLGRFDSSSQEFHSGQPDHGVRVAADDPAAVHDWYAFQPEQPTAGDAARPVAAEARTIAFQIAGAPAASYTINIALLIEHPGVPLLRVAVNGHTGSFFLNPKLVETENDEAVFFPSFSRAELSFDLPGSFLHPGENEISFAAVSETNDSKAPETGFHYDAISMEVAGQMAAALTKVRIDPTIFFRKSGSTLEEALDVIVRNDGTPAASADIALSGKHTTLKLDPASTWGEQKQRIYVPAFEQPTRATIELTAAGKTERTTQLLQPAKRWTLYIVPHIHLDIGYTDYQAKVAALHSRAIDESLDMFTVHPDFRFSLDGMWPLEQFMSTRNPVDQERAIAALKAGQLFVPAEYCNLLTGFASSEVLIRSLYPSAAFDQQHGLPLNYANITDVPSFSWSYASVLAAAGIPELLAGSNNGRGAPLLQGHLDHSSPYWWEGPDGGRVLMWYSHHYHQMWTTFGLPPRMRSAEETLPLFFQNYGGSNYKSNSTIMYGTQVENSDLYPEQAGFAGVWNSRYAYPHLEYSGFHQALSSIAADFKNDIPVVRGDGGPYWEDGIAADALYGGIERATEARAPSAEKLATISTLVNPRIVADKTSLDEMWKKMLLMDEHTWLSSDSYTDSQNDQAIVQLRVKDAYAIEASGLADWLLRNNMANIADSIDTPAHSLVVFNALNWARSGPVSIDIRKGQEVVDATTGQALPMSVTDHGEHTWRATFRAEAVPPVGYKTYLLRDTSAAPPAPSPATVLENDAYRIELDPASGAIRSIYDKSLRRDLVDATSPYRLGQYLYVTTEHHPGQPENYVVHPAQNGRLLSIEKNADGITAHLESTDLNTPTIHTTITLPAHGKTVLIDAEVDKKPTLDDEAVYFAFPFAMTHPQFKYEIQNGVVDPAYDMYPGAGHDWFSIQHWAAVQQDGAAAAVLPIDAPLMTFGDITRVTFPKEFGTRQGWIFSYAMNNYWHTNYRAAQGGHFQFRYIVTSAPSIDAVALSRLGWEESTPLEVSEVTASDKAVEWKRPLNGKSGSFLELDDPAVVLEAWKPAEDGRGTILRIIDLGGADLGGSARTTRLRLPLVAIEHAWADNALERDQSELPLGADPHSVEFTVKPHAIITLRILPHPTAKPPCGPYCR